MVSVSWANIYAVVPQGSILEPLLFCLYIWAIYWMILTVNVNCLLMRHLFFVVHDINTSANDRNHDLEKISEWNFQSKMKFNPDPTKQVHETIFGRKKTGSIHPRVVFNKTPVNSTATHKHLEMILDSKLSYENHLQSAFSWVNKAIGLLRKFQPNLWRNPLLAIYKSFTRPHLDYSDAIYDWASNECF